MVIGILNWLSWRLTAGMNICNASLPPNQCQLCSGGDSTADRRAKISSRKRISGPNRFDSLNSISSLRPNPHCLPSPT